jgi:hypothetical protein
VKHRTRWMTGLKLWAIALFAVAGMGCSGPLPTQPAVSEIVDATIGCTAETSVGPSTGSLVANPQWYTVASKSIHPLTGGVVSGSRYRVTVLPLALLQTTTISIREYNPNILDFELLPHGTQFLVPVTVDVDYAGTSLDPASPNYQGGLPVLLWLNPGTGLWELVPGVNNPLTKKYTVLLTHFSRYALGKQQGTAEW